MTWVCDDCSQQIATGPDNRCDGCRARAMGLLSVHEHSWQPAAVEKWISAPTVRIVALCSCGATNRFGVEDAA